MKELELTTSELVNFAVEPPRKRWTDYLPGPVIGYLRRRYTWKWLDITPWERWRVGLIFSRRMLQGLWAMAEERARTFEASYVPPDAKDLN